MKKMLFPHGKGKPWLIAMIQITLERPSGREEAL